jgi:uncharacterized protein
VHRNERLLRDYYDAVARGDVEAIEAMYADDVVFHAHPGGPLAGDYRGKDEVFRFIGTIMARSNGTFAFEVHDVLANDTHGVGLLRATAQREGAVLDQNVVHVIHIEDGELREFWGHWADQRTFDVFFS